MQSHAIFSLPLPESLCSQILIASTRFLPKTLEIAFPFSTLIPSAFARSANAPPPLPRASTIMGTSTPNSFRVIAVRYASSLLV